MDEIHFAPRGNHGKPLLLGIFGGLIILPFFRWCERISSIHSMSSFSCSPRSPLDGFFGHRGRVVLRAGLSSFFAVLPSGTPLFSTKKTKIATKKKQQATTNQKPTNFSFKVNQPKQDAHICPQICWAFELIAVRFFSAESYAFGLCPNMFGGVPFGLGISRLICLWFWLVV